MYFCFEWDQQTSSATHCNTLQHTATHCYTLPQIATHCNTLRSHLRISSLSGTKKLQQTSECICIKMSDASDVSKETYIHTQKRPISDIKRDLYREYRSLLCVNMDLFCVWMLVSFMCEYRSLLCVNISLFWCLNESCLTSERVR